MPLFPGLLRWFPGGPHKKRSNWFLSLGGGTNPKPAWSFLDPIGMGTWMNSFAVRTSWRDRLFRNWGFARSVAVLAGGTVTAQALNLLLAPVIVRLYTPSDVGRLALFLSYINVASVVLGLRYEFGIVSARSEREAAGLALLATIFTVPVGLLLAVAFHFLIKYSVLGFGALPGYAGALMMLALVLTGIFTTLRYWMIRENKFPLISQATILQQGLRVVSQAALGWFGASTAGLLAGEMAGRVTGIGRMFRDALPSFRKELAGIRLSELRELLVRNRKFPMFSVPSSIADATGINLIVPLIVLQYGSASGGQYALVSRVMSIPLVLIATSVADVFHSRMAERARQSPLSCSYLFWRTAGGLLLIGIFPAAIVVLFGQRLFAVVFGHTWATAGALAATMAPWCLMQFVVSPLSRLVLVLEGQEFKLAYDGFLLLSLCLVFGLAHHYHTPLLHTVRLLSWLNTVAYGIYFLVLVLLLRKKTTNLSAPVAELGETLGA